MRFRTHLLSSLAVGLALYPRRPARLVSLVAAGTLIDLDHLVLYGLQTGDWSLVGAVRYDRYRNRRAGAGDSRPRYGSLRSWLHDPLLVLPASWAAAARHPGLLPLALGLSLHLLLDRPHWPAQLGERLRAGGRCRACGQARGRIVVVRACRRGVYGYRALCRACAEREAAGPAGARRPRGLRRKASDAGRSTTLPVVH